MRIVLAFFGLLLIGCSEKSAVRSVLISDHSLHQGNPEVSVFLDSTKVFGPAKLSEIPYQGIELKALEGEHQLRMVTSECSFETKVNLGEKQSSPIEIEYTCKPKHAVYKQFVITGFYRQAAAQNGFSPDSSIGWLMNTIETSVNKTWAEDSVKYVPEPAAFKVIRN